MPAQFLPSGVAPLDGCAWQHSSFLCDGVSKSAAQTATARASGLVAASKFAVMSLCSLSPLGPASPGADVLGQAAAATTTTAATRAACFMRPALAELAEGDERGEREA